MQHGAIKNHTRRLGAAQGYRTLYVRDVKFDSLINGPATPAMQTAWFPTPAELVALQAGAPVILTILGNQHPPVLMDTGEIPADGNKL